MHKDIFTLAKEYLAICLDLLSCLEEERVALMTLNTEVIVQTNFKKENLGAQLKLKHRELSLIAKAKHGADQLVDVAKTLPEETRGIWKQSLDELKTTQLQLQSAAESNQRFLRHCIKNLGLIVENLKRLFGDQPLYSPQGKKVDGPQSGRMVEASY